MKNLPYLVLGLSLLASPLMAQRMGHGNTNAPTITQSIDLGEQGSVELVYGSIAWASGRWAEQLANEETRAGMRDMINTEAVANPLGSFKTSADLAVGGKRVAAGSYNLAFVLNEEYQWQMVLSAEENSIALPLQYGFNPIPSKRLILALLAGDEDFTARLLVAFGDKAAHVPIGGPVAEEPEAVASEAVALEAVASKEEVAEVTPPRRGVINTECPLMGDPVVADWVITYKGYNIGFCCEICYEEWDELEASDMDEILSDLIGGPVAQPVVAGPTVLNNPLCPMMDEPVVEGYSIVYKDIEFGVCCDDCILEWERFTEPERAVIVKKIWE